MNHDFTPSISDDKKCLHCKRGFRDHSIIAQCEACPNVGKCDEFCGMLLCAKCYAAEIIANKAAMEANNTPDKQAARVIASNETIKLNQLLVDSDKIDQSIQLVTDIFNAKTIALVELMKAIDNDPAIENKPYTRAETSVNRFKHLSSVIFDLKTNLVEAENEQRAIQVYLNQMMNQLKAEEREKLKLSDINYTPSAPKSPKSKSTGTKKVSAKSKVDMTEVKIWAEKIGMPINLVHMRMIKFGYNAEKAARTFAAETGLTIKE